ncbi:MAG: hypothetical protein WCO56_29690 [Verrucomicrobiota bacterium]
MPFSLNIESLIGKPLNIVPNLGFGGWRLTFGDEIIEEITTPQPFQAQISDLLYINHQIVAVLATIDLTIEKRRFLWGYFGCRTDSLIDLRERSVGCNILLSDTKPYLSDTVAYPDPQNTRTPSRIELRGQGRVSLERS